MSRADADRRLLRVGAVNYLNSRPLIEGFDRNARRLARGFQARLTRDLPSRLADSLTAGRLDVALAPVFEAFTMPDCRIVSDACVAAEGPVGSVKLYFRVPPAEVRTLALDEGSRTSASLAQVLLWRRHGVRPQTVPLPIGQGDHEADADAVLLIGDRAMFPPQDRYVAVWDLAEEWRRDRGGPFVFAVWIARNEVATTEVARLLEACRDDGLTRLGEIAADEGPSLGLTPEHAESYLRENLRFTLGSRELRALDEFRTLCRQAGLLPGGPTHDPQAVTPV